MIDSRHSTGFYYSTYGTLRMAIGMDHKYAEQPDHEAFDQLNGFFEALLASPRGHEALRTLDRLIPKSRVVIASKPGVPGRPGRASDRSSSEGNPVGRIERAHRPIRSPRGPIARAIRDGSIQVAGINLSWNVKRTPKGQG